MKATPGDGLVQDLAQDYSSSAGDYARFWGPAILPLALPLLEALPLRGARRVVDIGTGLGDLLPHLQARAPGARILGVDRSGGMIRLARESHGLDLAVIDARALALAPGRFDVVTLAFVLFHVPSPAEALAEAGRVLRPGGTIGLVTWSEEDPGLPGGAIWTEELDRRGAAPDPRDDRVRRHDLVDQPEKLARLLEGSGFGSIDAWTARSERPWDHESLLGLQRACGTASRRLSTLDADGRASCLAAVGERIAGLSADELVWRPAVVHAAARKL